MSIILRDATTPGNAAKVDAAGAVAVAVAGTPAVSISGTPTMSISGTPTFTVGNASVPVTVGNASVPVTVGNASVPVTVGNAVTLAEMARTTVSIFGTTLAVGSSNTEALLSLTQVRGTASGAGTSIITTAGKQLRLQTLVLTLVGNAAATATQATFRLRYNPAGAVTVTSTPVLLQIRLAAPATALSYTQALLTFSGDGLWLPPGDGVASLGFTVTPTYATNAPTVDVQALGFEV